MPKIAYPTQQEWEQKFTLGLKAASTGVTTSPAIRDMVVVLSVVIEQVTGKPLGVFVAEKVADLAATIARELALGQLPKIAAELGKQVAQIAGAVASIIPIIAAGIELGIEVQQAIAAEQEARMEKYTQRALQGCKNAYIKYKAEGTGSGGIVTPADLFRDVYEVQKKGPDYLGTWADSRGPKKGKGPYAHYGYSYPQNVGALFCALCGPQSPLGWHLFKVKHWTPVKGAAGATVREETMHPAGAYGYGRFLAQMRKEKTNLVPDPDQIGGPGQLQFLKLGLPYGIRKRCAAIIEGIMASVRPRTLAVVTKVGDQGSTLFPVLCDILLHEWRKGHWNKGMLRAFQNSQIGCYSVLNFQDGSRIAPVIDLSDEFYDVIMAWKNTIEVASADYGPTHKKYLSVGVMKVGKTKPRIVFRPSKVMMRMALTKKIAPAKVKPFVPKPAKKPLAASSLLGGLAIAAGLVAAVSLTTGAAA